MPLYGSALSLNSILMMTVAKEKKFRVRGFSLLSQNSAFCFLAIALFKIDFFKHPNYCKVFWISEKGMGTIKAIFSI